MILQDEYADLPTETGLMRTYLYRPVAPGRYPGVVLFSEIFQRTLPIGRMAAVIAGHGFVVAVPEIFHELEPPGTEIPYDQPGAERGNAHKVGKPIGAYDSDARAVRAHLRSLDSCTGRLGAMGICVGGHLAFRAAMSQDTLATIAFYPTDIHKGTLGSGGDDTLARLGEIRGEIVIVWGRQDPHIPLEGRDLIRARLSEANVPFVWLEVNGAHAFLRDEGPRYDPALALTGYRLAIDLFQRTLHDTAP
jgi:carboxymethylenebutenolidase